VGKFQRIKIPQVPATDIADPKLRGVVAAVRETLQTRGFGKDRWITMADLEEKGLIQVDNNGTVTVPSTGIAPPPATGDGVTIGCFPPPPPTGLEAEGIFTMVMLTWDAPPYPYSARHAFTEVWRAQQDNVGVAVFVGSTKSTMYTDVVGAGGGTWYYWARHVNECNGIGPFNALTGTIAQTLPDIGYLLELLEGQITEEQLYIDLNKRIDLVDGGPAMPGSVDQRIEHTETMFQNETDRLSQEISLLTTGVSGSLDPYKSWYFDADEEGWEAGGSPAPWVSGWISVTGTDVITLPVNFSPEINGAQYTVVVIRVTRLAGTDWKGRVRYRTAAHDFDDDYFVDILDPGIAAPTPGELNRENAETLYWDMSTLTAPSVDDEDWMKSGILAIELQLGNDPADEFAVDYITIGRFGPGASVASVYEESTARIAADQALAVQITNLRGQYETNLATINATLSALATTDQALAASITSLQASFTTEIGRLDARVNTEQTARASADSALASSVTTLSTTVAGHTATIQQHTASINGISAEYAVRLDVGGRVTGFGIYGSPTSTKFFVNADQFAIVGPSSGLNTAQVPFTVLTSPTVIDGVTIPAGTYIKDAWIKNAAITTAKIKDLAVEGAKIADATITTAKIGLGEITTALIGDYISSTVFTSGIQGWRIDKTGWAEFQNITARGHIDALSGTFAGTLTAATGNFTGSLTSVTGSFRELVVAPTSSAPGLLRSAEILWSGGPGIRAQGRGVLLGQRFGSTSAARTAYFFVGSAAGKFIEYDEATGNIMLNGEIVKNENIPPKEITDFVGDVAKSQHYGRNSLINGGLIVGDASYGIPLTNGAKHFPQFPTSYGEFGTLIVTAKDTTTPILCTATAMAVSFGDNGNMVVGMDYHNGFSAWVNFATSGGYANTGVAVNVSVTGRFLPPTVHEDKLVKVRMWVQANGASGGTQMRGENFSMTLSASKR